MSLLMFFKYELGTGLRRSSAARGIARSSSMAT